MHSSLLYTGQTGSSADENHLSFVEVDEGGFMRAAMKTACPLLAELPESSTFSPRDLRSWKVGKVEEKIIAMRRQSCLSPVLISVLALVINA